jgi:hypothetical protein
MSQISLALAKLLQRAGTDLASLTAPTLGRKDPYNVIEQAAAARVRQSLRDIIATIEVTLKHLP